LRNLGTEIQPHLVHKSLPRGIIVVMIVKTLNFNISIVKSYPSRPPSLFMSTLQSSRSTCTVTMPETYTQYRWNGSVALWIAHPWKRRGRGWLGRWWEGFLIEQTNPPTTDPYYSLPDDTFWSYEWNRLHDDPLWELYR